MYVVISYPKKGPYEYLFHKGRWFALEQELAHALTEYRSSLEKMFVFTLNLLSNYSLTIFSLSAGIKTSQSIC